MTTPVLTVSELTHAIKLNLEATFPSLWLQGEVSNCKLQTSGHLYFSLKDPKAQIGGVMFRGDMATLTTIPKDGDHVIVRGELNVYPPSGRYQIVVRELRQAGLGELLLRLEQLKVKLQQRGWFNPEHKKPLPKFPKRIGVVTSPTGAVIQDILNILTRRCASYHLILNPVRVQGEGAAKEIAQAIAQFNQHNLVDVMIVGRGGGSIEDLWAFNEEIVAEAIFNSRIPIISAVGHETDYCIADFVADVRAPTPSAAAELISTDKAHQMTQIKECQRRLQHTLSHLVRNRRHQLKGLLKQPLFLSPYALLGSWIQRLDTFRTDADNAIHKIVMRRRLLLEGRQRQVEVLKPSAQIVHFKQKLVQWERSIQHALQTRLINAKNLFNPTVKKRQLDRLWLNGFGLRKERLIKLSNALHAVDPKNLLTKGYSILFAEKGNSVITSIKSVKKEQKIRALLSDGELVTIVQEVKAHGEANGQ